MVVAGFFSWWVVRGWMMVARGFAWLFMGLLGRGFVGLFVANDCSWCCGGFAWLMVVRGGFFWCRGWVF